MLRWFRRLCGRPPDLMSDTWLKEQARRESRIEFHGSGQRWRFNRSEMDAAWRNRAALRRETEQQQERKRA